MSLEAIARESMAAEAEARLRGDFEGLDALPSIGHFDGWPATCRHPECRARAFVMRTISAHHWGCMVVGRCGHTFPAELT